MCHICVSICTFALVKRANFQALKKVVSDCDEAIVLLLQERAKATEMIAELRGPGNGMASAELSPEELDRIHRANTPGISHGSGTKISICVY